MPSEENACNGALGLMILRTDGQDRNKPKRKDYTITEAGLKALDEEIER